jgi:hypothetical protein
MRDGRLATGSWTFYLVTLNFLLNLYSVGWFPVPAIIIKKRLFGCGAINEKRWQHSVTIRVLLFAYEQQPFRQPMA